jgi:RNA polymerase sigma factor (sigma-70 family)
MYSEDAALVQHCLSGDADAFGVLVHKYQEMVYAYAFQKVGNEADAKDIAQEVFLRAYRHLSSLKFPHQFRTWLYTIMSNECKRWLARTAKNRNRETRLEEATDDALQVEPEYTRKQDDWQLDLEQALAKLSDDSRIAVSMFYMSNCSLKEIGEFLGVSANAVKVKLYRARQQLGQVLSESYGSHLKDHRLKGGFLMHFMEQIRQVRRPIVRPSWREQIIRQIPLTVASTFCVLLGVLGMLSYSQEQLWAIPEDPSATAPDTIHITESVELLPLAYIDKPTVPLAKSTAMGDSPSSTAGTEQEASQDPYLAQAAEGIRNQETSISGKVTSKADGKAIAGAKVWIGRVKYGVEKTDQDGNYTIHVERAGENRLWVAGDGFATQLMITTIARGQQLTGADFALVPGADAYGRVVDEEGNPIEGAEVWTSIESAAMESVKTDTQGRYILKGLEPSRKYHVTAGFDISLGGAHAKMGDKRPYYIDGWVEISVSKPGKIEIPDIVLRSRTGVTVSGRVTDESGEPVAGAEVVAGEVPYMSNGISAQTDDEGNYAVINVQEGENFVIVKAEGYAPDLRKVQVVRGQDMQMDFTVKPGGAIAGKVLDEDGKPIEGVHIAVGAWYNNRAVHHITEWAQTDADGEFGFDNLPELELQGAGLKAAVMKDEYSRIDGIEITPGSTDLEFVMKPSGKLAGRVVDAQTSKPITSFTVKLGFPKLEPGEDVPRAGMAATWARKGHSFVSPKGEFLASDFVLGCVYELTVIAEGYTPATIDRVTTSAKPNAVDLIIKLEKERAISGVVTDAKTSEPLENAAIWHFNSTYPMVVSGWSNVARAGTESVQSGSDGSFSIGGGSGENFLYVHHPRYAPVIIGPFEIKAGEEPSSVTVKLTRGGKVTGYVKSGAESVSGARMELSLVGGIPNLEIKDPHGAMRGESAFAFMESVRTSDEGYFEFDHLMPGEYRLTQMIEGEGSASSVRMTEVKVSEGKTISLDFGGGGGAILRGKVTDEEGIPLSNVAVRARVDDDLLRSGGADYTDSDGRYEIRDLPPGIHQLMAIKIEPCRPGEVCPLPMRYSGPIEVSEGQKEIEHDIRMTAQQAVPPRTTKTAFPIDADSSGKEIRLPEDTTERLPVNGDFEDDLADWTRWQSRDDDSTQTCEVVYDEEKKSNVVEFERTNGGRDGSRVGIAQDTYIDLSKYDELYLQLDVKPMYQSLSGGGWAGGGEYPVTVELAYIDQKGTAYRWRHGIYYKDESRYSDSSTKLPQNAWFTYTSPNLKEILPVCADKLRVEDGRRWGKEFREYEPPVNPEVITRILIFGGGWDFIGRADNLRFRTTP